MRVASLMAACAMAAGLAVSGAAQAGVIFQTGFEDYALGALNGQNGWQVFGAAVPEVTDTLASSGTQSVVLHGGTAGQSGPFHTDPSSETHISVSADIYLSSSTSQGSWQFGMLGSGLSPFFGGVDIGAAGNIVAISQGYPSIGSFTRDAWHNIDVRLNFDSRTFDVLLDHTLIGNDIAFCGDNTTCTSGTVDTYSQVLFDTFGSTGFNDAGYIDNVRVATFGVPEPTSWALMLTGFLGLGGALRVRKTAKLA